jgi:hypothetical protein
MALIKRFNDQAPYKSVNEYPKDLSAASETVSSFAKSSSFASEPALAVSASVIPSIKEMIIASETNVPTTDQIIHTKGISISSIGPNLTDQATDQMTDRLCLVSP